MFRRSSTKGRAKNGVDVEADAARSLDFGTSQSDQQQRGGSSSRGGISGVFFATIDGFASCISTPAGYNGLSTRVFATVCASKRQALGRGRGWNSVRPRTRRKLSSGLSCLAGFLRFCEARGAGGWKKTGRRCLALCYWSARRGHCPSLAKGAFWGLCFTLGTAGGMRASRRSNSG